MRSLAILLILATLAGGAYALWWFENRPERDTVFALYGNVDLRQVEAAFTSSERIAEVLVQEGDRVKQGQILASLETIRIEPQVAQAQAQVEAYQAVIQKLRTGSRPEEIAQARANVEAAQAEQSRARQQHDRLLGLSQESAGRAVSDQDLENARAALDVAAAGVTAAQKALDLVLAGPRQEDIAQAEAQLRGAEAQLVFLRQQLTDAKLLSPADAVVRSRLMEPGEIAFPQKPVISLAITDPKWVRAYVSEPHLGKLKPGMRASVVLDSYPDRSFDAWIGFISPVAEFTPKSVQTEDLRSSLVYQVRVFVADPLDELRLGMPASVYLQPELRDQTAGAANEPKHPGSQ